MLAETQELLCLSFNLNSLSIMKAFSTLNKVSKAQLTVQFRYVIGIVGRAFGTADWAVGQIVGTGFNFHSSVVRSEVLYADRCFSTRQEGCETTRHSPTHHLHIQNYSQPNFIYEAYRGVRDRYFWDRDETIRN